MKITGKIPTQLNKAFMHPLKYMIYDLVSSWINKTQKEISCVTHCSNRVQKGPKSGKHM